MFLVYIVGSVVSNYFPFEHQLTMSLTPDQAKIIKATVPVLREHGNEITTRFYEEMLAEVPDLNDVFNHTNQVNGHQAAALAGSLYAYAAHIDDLGALSPAVERICQKHASLYVRPEHYKVVGTYLLRAMKEVLGDALTPEIKEAWAAAYEQLASMMIDREDQLLEEADGWTDWRDFHISQKIRESSEITSFHLSPVDGKPLPSYMPGQYISIRTSVPDLHYLQARQYSLSDKPTPDHYRITVKKEPALDIENPKAKSHPGYISNILHDEKNIGDLIQVSHPAGEFYLNTREETDTNAPIVLISAGVGLTPELSILSTLLSKGLKRKISWVHAARSSDVQAFGKEIQELARTHSNVQTHVFVKEPGKEAQEGVDYQFTGRMSLNKLDTDHDLFIHDERAEYYVCGPEKFMAEVESVLTGWGVDQKRIKLEIFNTGDIPRQ
jgi:nitric oxide dioxygenase